MDAAFAFHERLADQVSACQAGLMILPPSLAQLASRFRAAIVVADPYLYFAQVAGPSRRPIGCQVQQTQVHPSAVVAQTAQLGQRVRIAAGVVIEEGAEMVTTPTLALAA